MDIITLVAIALVVYTTSSILHEAVGHGLTCVLLGGKVVSISSTACIAAGEPLGQSADRIIAAGGTLVNLMSAALFWRLFLSRKSLPANGRYFLWLSMTVNGFMGAGYLAVPTFIGFGDWMIVLRELNPHWAWRMAFIVAGVVLYGAVAYVAVRTLEPFLGRDVSDRRNRGILAWGWA